MGSGTSISPAKVKSLLKSGEYRLGRPYRSKKRGKKVTSPW